MPSGPVILTSVGEGEIVTEGGNMIGSRPIIDTFLQTLVVVLKQRAK